MQTWKSGCLSVAPPQKDPALSRPLCSKTQIKVTLDSQDIGSKDTSIEEKNKFEEEWAAANLRNRRAQDVPVHITTMSHDDETPAGQMNFTQNSNAALLRRSVSGIKIGLRSCPGRKNIE